MLPKEIVTRVDSRAGNVLRKRSLKKKREKTKKKKKKNRRKKKKETICNETRAVRRDYGIEMREEERWHGRERMRE